MTDFMLKHSWGEVILDTGCYHLASGRCPFVPCPASTKRGERPGGSIRNHDRQNDGDQTYPNRKSDRPPQRCPDAGGGSRLASLVVARLETRELYQPQSPGVWDINVEPFEGVTEPRLERS